MLRNYYLFSDGTYGCFDDEDLNVLFEDRPDLEIIETFDEQPKTDIYYMKDQFGKEDVITSTERGARMYMDLHRLKLNFRGSSMRKFYNVSSRRDPYSEGALSDGTKYKGRSEYNKALKGKTILDTKEQTQKKSKLLDVDMIKELKREGAELSDREADKLVRESEI